ncbi:hypothetical protein K438DRAFT_2028508 [Mycena galopus ATCC 62051]|nr:hypothetical protein K438DRAFT_2028508 [Mycena galopus ATCC 62051]
MAVRRPHAASFGGRSGEGHFGVLRDEVVKVPIGGDAGVVGRDVEHGAWRRGEGQGEGEGENSRAIRVHGVYGGLIARATAKATAQHGTAIRAHTNAGTAPTEFLRKRPHIAQRNHIGRQRVAKVHNDIAQLRMRIPHTARWHSVCRFGRIHFPRTTLTFHPYPPLIHFPTFPDPAFFAREVRNGLRRRCTHRVKSISILLLRSSSRAVTTLCPRRTHPSALRLWTTHRPLYAPLDHPQRSGIPHTPILLIHGLRARRPRHAPPAPAADPSRGTYTPRPRPLIIVLAVRCARRAETLH